jgi:hypothetical protein
MYIAGADLGATGEPGVGDTVPGDGQHLLRQLDPDHVAHGRRVARQVKAGPNCDLHDLATSSGDRPPPGVTEDVSLEEPHLPVVPGGGLVEIADYLLIRGVAHPHSMPECRIVVDHVPHGPARSPTIPFGPTTPETIPADRWRH